jgi:hypothetical protein
MAETVVSVADLSPRMDRVSIAERSDRRRKRKKLPRHAYDRRSRLGRRIRTLVGAFRARLAEDAVADPVVNAAVDRAAELTALAENLRQRALRGERVPPDDIVRTARLADQSVRALRLDRRDKPDDGPSLDDIMRESGGGAP